MDVTAKYTIKGLELRAKMETGVCLKITRIAAGTGRNADIESINELAEEKQELTITGCIQRGTQAQIYALLSNNGVESGYDLTQIGVFAEDPDEGEILYRIAQMERAFPISAEKDIPNFSIGCMFTDTVSNASTVNVTVDPAGMVTVSQMEAVLAIAQEALELAREGVEKRETISNTAPEDPNDGDVWLKPIGSINFDGEISGVGTTPLYLSGSYVGSTPPVETGMLWVKPIT